MYDIALSVGACVRAGTRADVAWMIAPEVRDDALSFTPGGGRIGGMAGGAFDGMLGDAAERRLSSGRYVQHRVTEFEGSVCGLAAGTAVAFLVVPAAQFPARMWSMMLDREPVVIVATRSGDEITQIRVQDAGQASQEDRAIIEAGHCAAFIQDDQIVTVLVPTPRLVVAGGGPIAEALAAQGRLLAWKVSTNSRPEAVAGLAATLTELDAIVVLGHDVESSSRCLMAALASQAGYIGAVGSKAMQQSRADWLAYQDVTDLRRVHGPAGLDIQARNPAEVAVAIVAEILAGRAKAS